MSKPKTPLPCPYCGARAVRDSNIKGAWRITHRRGCYFKGTKCAHLFFDGRDEYKIAWNRRKGGETMAEIRDLALFCGFTVDGNGAETRDAEELETEIAVEAVDHGIKDDDGTEHRYAHIAWYEEYPDEGAMGLGPELPNNNLTGG